MPSKRKARQAKKQNQKQQSDRAADGQPQPPADNQPADAPAPQARSERANGRVTTVPAPLLGASRKGSPADDLADL